MSQADRLLEMFIENNWVLLLSQMTTEEARFKIGVKHTNRVDDLKKRGYKIVCFQNHEQPGKNRYEVQNPDHIPFDTFCPCQPCFEERRALEEIPTPAIYKATPMNLPFGDML